MVNNPIEHWNFYFENNKMKTYFLQVKEIVSETSDAATIYFWHPLSEQIKYKAGQFITLIVPADNGKKVRRSYSMSTSPSTDTSVGITIKRVENGLVSNYLLDRVKVGDFLEVIEPMGHFLFDPNADNNPKKIVLIGAGSGITPLISIAKTVLKNSSDTQVFLLYGNRNEESIIFKKELENLENSNAGRFHVKHILSQAKDTWVGEKGRINQASAVYLLKTLGVDFKTEAFYMCGPAEMMEELQKVYDLFEVPKSRIHKENFHSAMLDNDDEPDESLKTRKVKVIYDGSEHEFSVEPHQTILEAALDLDIDLPYSCQAGMCTACMGKCKTGKVKMDEDDGLTETEIKNGFLLTCVAHPLTDDVVIEIE